MRKVRNSFNRELELLNMELTNMGKAIETAIDYAEISRTIPRIWNSWAWRLRT